MKHPACKGITSVVIRFSIILNGKNNSDNGINYSTIDKYKNWIFLLAVVTKIIYLGNQGKGNVYPPIVTKLILLVWPTSWTPAPGALFACLCVRGHDPHIA